MTTASIEARVRVLEITLELQGLLAAYATALDRFDEAALRAIIMPDIRMGHDAVSAPVTSADQMVAVLMASRPNIGAIQHYVTNPLVKLLDEETAELRASIFAMHVLPGEGPSAARLVPAGGTYLMHVKRDGDGWKIARLQVDETWFDDRIALIYK
jgi:hypothetical protein